MFTFQIFRPSRLDAIALMYVQKLLFHFSLFEKSFVIIKKKRGGVNSDAAASAASDATVPVHHHSHSLGRTSTYPIPPLMHCFSFFFLFFLFKRMQLEHRPHFPPARHRPHFGKGVSVNLCHIARLRIPSVPTIEPFHLGEKARRRAEKIPHPAPPRRICRCVLASTHADAGTVLMEVG